MFRITRLTDYGVLLMTQLAKNADEVRNAADLAEQVHVPLPTVSKILQILLHDHLLESVRGAGGGYRLARSAVDISVRDIIVALEGPIALTECTLESGNCVIRNISDFLMKTSPLNNNGFISLHSR